MDIIELSYKKPSPDMQLGLYRVVDGNYVEVSGGGYARQKYAGGTVKFPMATGDWGTVHALGLNYQGQLHVNLLSKAFFVCKGDQFNLSINLENQ